MRCGKEPARSLECRSSCAHVGALESRRGELWSLGPSGRPNLVNRRIHGVAIRQGRGLPTFRSCDGLLNGSGLPFPEPNGAVLPIVKNILTVSLT